MFQETKTKLTRRDVNLIEGSSLLVFRVKCVLQVGRVVDMVQQNAPLASLLSIVDAAGVAMAAPADRADNIYMDAGNYSRSWDQPIVVRRKFDMKGWLLLLLGRHSAA